MDDNQLQALQFVVNRVSAYQDGAPEGTVEKELRKALAEADINLDDDQVERLTASIERDPGSASASDALA